MGKYRKATQLVIKVAELIQHVQDKQVLSAQEVAMQDLLLSKDLTFTLESLTFSDGGEGFTFTVANKNAALSAHVKFHHTLPILNPTQDQLKKAGIQGEHMVIEKIEFVADRNGTTFSIEYQDDVKRDSRFPAYGIAVAKKGEKLDSLPKELMFNGHPRVKPRLYLSISSEWTYNQGAKMSFWRPLVGIREGSETYTILKNLYRETSNLPTLFEAAEKLFKNFNEIVRNNWEGLFQESDEDLVPLPATRRIETPKLTEFVFKKQKVPDSSDFNHELGKEAASSSTSSTSTSPEKQQQEETPTIKVK